MSENPDEVMAFGLQFVAEAEVTHADGTKDADPPDEQQDPDN